jgi:hypothetical protein
VNDDKVRMPAVRAYREVVPNDSVQSGLPTGGNAQCEMRSRFFLKYRKPAAQATTRVPEAAARSERYTLAIELDLASRNLGLKSQLSRSYSNGSLHYVEGRTEKL